MAPEVVITAISERKLDRPNPPVPPGRPHPVRTYAISFASGLGIGLYAFSVSDSSFSSILCADDKTASSEIRTITIVAALLMQSLYLAIIP